MKNKLVRFALAASALVASQVAFAQASNQTSWFSEGTWYLSGSGSVNWHNKMKQRGTSGTLASPTQQSKYKAGGGAALALGYKMDQWRFEVEGSFRQNKVKTNTANPFVITSSGGSIRYWNLMFNAFYDFELMEDLSLYLGAGLGWSNGQMKASSTVSGANVNISSRTNQLGLQAMTGLAWKFHEQWALFAGYRFFTTTRPKYKSAVVAGNPKSKFSSPYISMIEAGLRFSF
jgi:opacity protein-like surface antigen